MKYRWALRNVRLKGTWGGANLGSMGDLVIYKHVGNLSFDIHDIYTL